jgi:2-polyprenyl-3-methyl-5-hydroxy-6-metoxy-1,4-benzoquinol methylase
MSPETPLSYWERAAAAYSASRQGGPLALSALYEPVVDALVGEIAGRHVLDAGCGDGHLARILAARGARVIAIDGSRAMLALAARPSFIVARAVRLADARRQR